MKMNLHEELNHAINNSSASLLEISWSLEVTPERLTELRAGIDPTSREEMLIRKMIQKVNGKPNTPSE